MKGIIGNKFFLTTAGVCILLMSVPSWSNTDYSFGGFIKADALWSDHSDQQRSAAPVGDDFYVPSQVRVGDGSGNYDTVFDTHIKHSRIWFKAVAKTDRGTIKAYIETDFNQGGTDERLTNQASSGVRHAFVDWSYSDTASLLVGQTWSTFFNVGALPEAVDFIGPAAGTLFIRQTQMRWTQKLGTVGSGRSFMIAAENPSTSLNGPRGNSKFDDNSIPDLVVRYNGKSGGLSYSAALMGREIAYRISDNNGSDKKSYSYGISLAGKYMFANGDDLKFMLNHGTLGRYIALNVFRDGTIKTDGSIELRNVTGWFVAFRHHWTPKLRSTLSYAMATADNPEAATTNTKLVSNGNLNLMYSPTKALTFGAEYIVASRELEDGTDGSLTRLQFMAKYSF